MGNLLTITDPQGNVASNNINELGLPTLTQDKLGNQTIFTYDDQGNKLSQSAHDRYSDDIQSISYEYNPDGIRTSKTVDGSLTKFIVDSNRDYAQVIAEQINNFDIQKEYVFGYDLLSQRQLSRVDGEDISDTAFYHYDSLGTTRNLSNVDGTLTGSYYYETFGELIASDGETNNSYLYTGEQFDADLCG